MGSVGDVTQTRGGTSIPLPPEPHMVPCGSGNSARQKLKFPVSPAPTAKYAALCFRSGVLRPATRLVFRSLLAPSLAHRKPAAGVVAAPRCWPCQLRLPLLPRQREDRPLLPTFRPLGSPAAPAGCRGPVCLESSFLQALPCWGSCTPMSPRIFSAPPYSSRRIVRVTHDGPVSPLASSPGSSRPLCQELELDFAI